MPSEHIAAVFPQAPDQSQQQIKLCSSCHCPLAADSSNTPFLLYEEADANDAAIVCGPCRTSLLAHPPVSIARGEFLFAQVERELRRRAEALPDENNEAHHPLADPLSAPAHNADLARQFSLDQDVQMESPVSARPQPQTPSHPTPAPYTASPVSPSPALASQTAAAARRPLRVVVARDAVPHYPQTPASSYAAHHSPAPISRASSSRSQVQPATSSYPDPLVDITRLRVRSQGHHCLYPGASFQGTQKSGRNSYDVNVTIVVRIVLSLSRFVHPALSCCGADRLFSRRCRISTLPPLISAATSESAASPMIGPNSRPISMRRSSAADTGS